MGEKQKYNENHNETDLYDVINDFPYYHLNITYTDQEIEDAKEQFLIHELLLIMGLLSLAIFGSIIIKKIKIKYLNDCLLAVLVGLLGGWLVTHLQKPKYVESITKGYLKVFIIFLLPPIIFESAYNIKLKEFYKNLGAILLYAIIGTLISIIFIGFFTWKLGILNLYKGFAFRESLAIGALISATDPVCIIAAFKEYTTDPNFFLLVFGESILNDAVSMVFYDSVADYEGGGSTFENLTYPLVNFFVILLGSTIVGMLIGFFSSIFLKFMSSIQKNIDRIEVGTLLTLPWFAYLCCHTIGLSAIVVIFFIGVSLNIYSKPFISTYSQEAVHTIYGEVATVAENIVFIFIGIAFFANHPYNDLTFSLPFAIILLCLIARFINIVVCSYLANTTRNEKTRIGAKKQFFLWFAGVRGAMAFALAIKSKFDFPSVGSMFLLLCLLITAFTLIYSSILLELTLNRCEIILKETDQVNDDRNSLDNRNETIREKNSFEVLKGKMADVHQNFLLPYVERKHGGDEGIKEKLIEDFRHH